MKLLSFEHPGNTPVKQDMIETINKTSGCLLICNDDRVTYQWFGLSKEQVISGLELVKMAVLKEMV